MSPLTVYRWELPDDAPEARRPRGKIKERLDALARAGTGATPARPAPSADELAPIGRALERLESGELAAAEDALLTLLASGALRSSAARALATQGIARAELWSRADARGAFTMLLPLLADADALPASVACEVHLTAALVWSALDGRIFDAGKTHVHAARAEALASPERAPAVRFLAWHARVSAAYTLNDPALLALALERAGEIDTELASPLLRCFAEEIRAISGMFQGTFAAAQRHVAAALALAREHRFAHLEVRLLSQVVRQQADDCVDPDDIDTALARIDSIAREARIVSGWHSMFGAYAGAEAGLRAGRWDRAERAVREHLRLAEELRWSPGTAPLFLARVLLLRGRGAELRAEGERMRAAPTVVFARVSELVAECVLAIADAVEGRDPIAAVERFAELAREIDAAGAWSYLRRNVAIAYAAIAVLAGDASQRARAIHRAQQTLDRIPSVWGSAAIEALRGVIALREGRAGEARAALERALGAFELARDRPHVALVRHALALAGGDDRARLDAERELARLGVAPLVIASAPAVSPEERASDAPLARVLAAQRRLAVRGMSPVLVQRELLAALAQVYPGAALRLDELDSRGEASPVGAIGEPDGPLVLAELGDGSGRRFRVGVATRDPGAPEVVSGIAAIAGLALEVASLRGLADRAAPPDAGESPEVPGFIAVSPSMRRLRADLARLGRSRSTVIVTGESGSGKEVVARAIHDLSVRAGAAYVAFNCAAVPRDLFEGQLFGYRKGAFTGAAADHPGVIRAADGGTLFLDEIAELPLDVQPKLLRFLENGEIFPLGERRPLRVDVRVIAATFRDLEELVRAGRFREDLFYRLQVVPLRVPPLRERPEDLVALARHFVQTLTPPGAAVPALAPDAIAALLAHRWPGNVRELRNVIERTLAFDPLPETLAARHLRIGG